MAEYPVEIRDSYFTGGPESIEVRLDGSWIVVHGCEEGQNRRLTEIGMSTNGARWLAEALRQMADLALDTEDD